MKKPRMEEYFILPSLKDLLYMKWSKYNVLLFSKKIGYILFNSRMLSLTKLDKETYTLFLKIKEDVTQAKSLISEEDYEHLVKLKFFVSDMEDDNYINMLKYRKQMQSYTSKSLGLVVCPTLSCNFACPYCYEHNLPKTTMNEDVQYNLVSFINEHSEGMESLTLNWHGGEPLTAFGTIKQIYTNIENKVQLPIKHSSMVSNGYLLTENICKYLEEKKLNYLQITIDGNKETHNRTRRLKNGESSFEKIIKNIDMATELMPNCCIGVRTNIGKDNRDEYVSLYSDLSNRWKGKNCKVYHAYVLDNGMNTCEEKRCSLELTTEEKNQFEVMLSKYGVKNKKTLYPRLDSGTYTCMDQNAYVVDPEGFLYKCWADVGIKRRSIGTLASGITNYDIVSQFMVATDKFSDRRCLECSYLPVCDGGCNLYRVGKREKGIPYNVCSINDQGLLKYLETYIECL